MQHKRIARALARIALAALVVLVATFNFTNLTEAYGSDPPYYSRTTNMDKWTDPLPVLTVIDAATVVAVAVGLRLLRRQPPAGPNS
jgi:hypothetical protein